LPDLRRHTRDPKLAPCDLKGVRHTAEAISTLDRQNFLFGFALPRAGDEHNSSKPT
jgi:hypothetical protein